MTQGKQDHVKRFRKAFPEMNHYSDMEVMAYCRDLKKEKRSVDRFIEGKVQKYGRQDSWTKKNT